MKLVPLHHLPIDVLKRILGWIPDQSIDACLLKQTCRQLKKLLVNHMGWQTPTINPQLEFHHDIALMKRYLPDINSDIKETLAKTSLKHGHLKTFKVFYDQSHFATLRVEYPAVPVEYGHLECLNGLVEMYPIMLRHYAYNLALVPACHYGHLFIVKYLYSMGANLSYNANQAVQAASFEGHLDVVQHLCDHGVDIHDKSEYAIRMACENGHLHVVKYLHSKGADLTLAGDYGFRFACKNGHLNVVEYFFSIAGLSDYISIDSGMLFAAKSGRLEVIQYLCSIGVDIHHSNDLSIRHAARQGHLAVVQYLHAMGANIHADHNYALRWATKRGHSEVVQFIQSCP